MEIGRPYSRLLYRLEKSGPLSPQGRQGVAELPMTVTNVAAGQEVVHHGDAPSRCTLVFGWFFILLQACKRIAAADHVVHCPEGYMKRWRCST
jgi:hypothetical protein